MKYATMAAMVFASTSADIIVHTHSYASEITWGITDAKEQVVCKGGPYSKDDTDYPSECSIPDTKYTLWCIDNYGDGWHGGHITIGGKKYCEDFTTGHVKSVTIEQANTFDYSSTGGHSAINRQPVIPTKIADLIRGSGPVGGKHTNTNNNGVSDDAKWSVKIVS